VPAGEQYVEVAVDAPSLRTPAALTYRAPAELPAAAAVGQLIWVPVRQQWKLGIVLAVSEQPPDFAVRDVYAIVEPAFRLSAEQLALGRWLSRRYLCGLFDALRPMLPPGATHRAVVAWRLARPLEPEELAALSPAQRALVELIAARGQATLAEAQAALKPRRGIAAAGAALERAGVLQRHAAIHQGAPKRRTEQLLAAAPAEGRLTPAQRRAYDYLLRHAPAGVRAAEVRRETGVSQAVLAALVRGGHATVQTVPVLGRDRLAAAHRPPPALTPAQADAWARLSAAVAARRYAAILLHGVTGSGKTELYLRAAAQTLRQGRGCILLAPEIALATQLVERVSDRFPGQVAVLHSALSDTERYEQWQLVRAGQRRVVVGPRSALFAPVADLGLIVLDEEHDAAYKQEAPPRFHARAVADYLARQCGATLVLGSATPDVVTTYAAERGRLLRLALPERVGAGNGNGAPLPLPEVAVVDMRRELREGNTSLFSRPLQAAVTRALAAGEQALLFLNRRGEATIVLCRACGYVAQCAGCEIPMVYHRVGERLICHRCGARRAPPALCPACGSPKIRYFGAGTQRVEAEVARLWPRARVLRWDQDAITSQHSHADLLGRVRRHEVDIVVGTQMIAKGLDLPRVMTVGVVAADTLLHLPDFRSAERTFQLLTQVAGRAGRAAPGGVVVMQSYTPEHYCLQAAAAHDYAAFYAEEIAFRRAHRYPPFARLALFVYAHRNELVCQRETAALVEQLTEAGRRLGLADLEVLGPAPCFARRVRGDYRWQVLARAPSLAPLLDDILVPPGWVVDVDPVSLL
jgi:primosomal protein N' (replication factor Y)